ncbi:hypothetical protein [Lachnotalea glycerini]|uniref:hypothetical protein n=1 Tax=Lachnotalea glycerini TaxID=1763509 RepID=UPI001FA836CF|nr:hypothetical protein [Lachnotalea glycerini]
MCACVQRSWTMPAGVSPVTVTRLLYQALTKENLNRAYKKVANKGASGIDEVTVEEWETISEKIRKQS